MLDAEILLSHVLDLSKAKLFSHFNDPLKSHQQERFFILVDRRAAHEPIAYLIGKKAFFTRDFLTNPFVLIPRPETEFLVEQALKIFEEEKDKDRVLFVDVGTGSGAIAVTLAAETQTPVLASDVSERALNVAKTNAQTHQVESVIDFRVGDLLTPLLDLFTTIRSSSKKPVSSVYPFKHLIVCANLPYLTRDQMETLPLDVKSYEPHGALEAGPDGMEAYWRLFKQLQKERSALPRVISVLIEIDPSQSARATQLIMHAFPDARLEIKKDLAGLDRLVIAEL